eukprot:SAG31_NODE_182_length_21094_cov_4.426721_12_plen_90_part_00
MYQSFPEGVMYDSDEILKMLPLQLQNELLLDLYGPVLDAMPFVPQSDNANSLAKAENIDAIRRWLTMFVWSCCFLHHLFPVLMKDNWQD